MTAKLEFNCGTTGIGSMPDIPVEKAISLIKRYLTLPYWPQMPFISKFENMYVQFSEGFPGIQIVDSKISVVRSPQFDSQFEKLYNDYEENNFAPYGISPEYAAGFYKFRSTLSKADSVKGQITGPISWGLSVTDPEGRGIIYDDAVAEIVAKFLHLKASWEEQTLQSASANTIIFVDEPYLASLGSAFVAISNEKVSSLLKETLSGIKGIKGIHCCGSTDWSLLLRSGADILSFDAYNYADSLSTYSRDVMDFIGNGNAIAWGIVPNDEETLASESVSSLLDRLGEAIAPYTRTGISFKQVIAQSLLTPSCGLASLSIESATRVLELLSELSQKIRSKYL